MRNPGFVFKSGLPEERSGAHARMLPNPANQFLAHLPSNPVPKQTSWRQIRECSRLLHLCPAMVQPDLKQETQTQFPLNVWSRRFNCGPPRLG